jgi:hypothetical protein
MFSPADTALSHPSHRLLEQRQMVCCFQAAFWPVLSGGPRRRPSLFESPTKSRMPGTKFWPQKSGWPSSAILLDLALCVVIPTRRHRLHVIHTILHLEYDFHSHLFHSLVGEGPPLLSLCLVIPEVYLGRPPTIRNLSSPRSKSPSFEWHGCIFMWSGTRQISRSSVPLRSLPCLAVSRIFLHMEARGWM